MSKQSKSFISFFYGKNTIKMLNALFTIMLVGGLVMIVGNSFREVTQLAEIANPWSSAIVMALAIPILSYILALGSNVDRHCAEDYSFQLMANAALVAVTTVVLCNLLGKLDFVLELTGLRQLQADDMVGIVLISWSVGFFYFQRKGLK